MPPASRSSNGSVMTLPEELQSGRESLPLTRCLEIHRVMVLCRRLEERCIKMSKSGEAYFWVGGPGEEAFNVCLGMQLLKGCGPAYDYVHLHYRNLGVLLGMGMPIIEHVRQMAMTVTDPHSMGRNFVSHYSKKDWNVIPVTSVIEVQYSMAPGTALMQKRQPDGEGVSAVIGGEAGSAEGDFATCMIWSSRPGNELPVLIMVTNNGWGISTPAESQHAEANIIDRGQPFGIPGEVVDGNDAIASWHALQRGFRYCRTRRKPYMIEAKVSRLHGHTSSSGAARVPDETDCVFALERKLREAGVDEEDLAKVHTEAKEEIEAAVKQALSEQMPGVNDIYTHTYAPSAYDAVYPEDYDGLPK